MSDPAVVAAGQGRRFPGPTGTPMTVKIDSSATGGAYSLIEYSHAPHAPGPPPHVHEHHEEAFRVLAGELSLDVGARTLTLGAGEYAVVPRGEIHRPYNAGEVECRFLFITSPALDGFFAEMADLNAATNGHPPTAALKELGARWDCVFSELPEAGDAVTRMVNETPPS
ncbi:cupin domain-containing protein [Streptomyces parvus]|uniref:cupin domain-containing protein n=1 Tax=Streptomyces parvus TaxID=66428 RepID=UPI00210189A8|nr:cupin domain-containing protein [Streptomyces parvus]MCQ1577687.1 cupin domain-containing protein [Streptomyces parvus]